MALDVPPEGDEHVDMEGVPAGLTHGGDHADGRLSKLLEGEFLVRNGRQFAMCRHGRYEGRGTVICSDKC